MSGVIRVGVLHVGVLHVGVLHVGVLHVGVLHVGVLLGSARADTGGYKSRQAVVSKAVWKFYTQYGP